MSNLKYTLRKLSKRTGFSVGEIAAALGIPVYNQRVLQGLKPGEAMPSHEIPRAVRLGARPRKGCPGTYRAILEATGRASVLDVPVKAPVPFARRDAIRIRRVSRAAKRRALAKRG